MKKIYEPQAYFIKVKPINVHALDHKGLIEIPEELVDKEIRGTSVGKVVAMGPEVFDSDKMKTRRCEVGDTIHFNQYSGTVVTEESGEKFLSIIDEDVYLKEVEVPE